MIPETPKAPEAMTAGPAPAGGGWQLRGKIAVPSGPTRLRVLLPVVQSLADHAVGAAVMAAEERGQQVSCRKGCGACCRQLVPIAEEEARQIRDLVEALPEPRRTEVRSRFSEARRRLDEAGLLEQLRHPEEWKDPGESLARGMRYFAQAIPCPFLEEESCSIHADRPLICREYLVTTPAANCSQPSAETVRCVPMLFQFSIALKRLHDDAQAERSVRWVPLILAPEWAEAHPEEPAARPGPEWVNALVENLALKDRPPSKPPGTPGSGTDGSGPESC
jgi:Fe-S-cluster containining protein